MSRVGNILYKIPLLIKWGVYPYSNEAKLLGSSNPNFSHIAFTS